MSIIETTSKNTSKLKIDSSTITKDLQFAEATCRARTIIVVASKLKPGTKMNTFFSNIDINSITYPTVRIEIPIDTPGKFIGVESGIQTDNITLRTTPLGAWDIINVGELLIFGTLVIGQSNVSTTGTFAPANGTGGTLGNGAFIPPGTFVSNFNITSGGSAIVIKDEVVYEDSTQHRYLYVCNIKGYISYPFFGQSSNIIPTGIIGITTDNLNTNSLGNFYATICLTPLRFNSGINNVMISDSTTPDPTSAETVAVAPFSSNGIQNTYVSTITNTQQTINTQVVTVNSIEAATSANQSVGTVVQSIVPLNL